MTKLAEQILAASPTSVALLLCAGLIYLSYMLIKALVQKYKGRSLEVSDAGVILNRQWFERMNEAAKRTHEIPAMQAHREWAAKEINALRTEVGPLVRDFERWKEKVENLDEKMDEMKRSTERSWDEIKRTLDKHDEKLDRLLGRLSQ